MSDLRLSPRADVDLARIFETIASDSGARRAMVVHARLERAARNLAQYPLMGHARSDLTAKRVLFWSVHSYLASIGPREDLSMCSASFTVRAIRGSCAGKSASDSIRRMPIQQGA